MKKGKNSRAPREIFWPVGPDATCPGPLTDPEGSCSNLPRRPMRRPEENADVREA